ncbi:MAG: hypothetical protein KBF88_05535 [Polyangiaceae bacterium]|nr:hypothetical protein [Polyangiaceae bacterium]
MTTRPSKSASKKAFRDLAVFDRFAEEGHSLRAHFDTRFADPRRATRDRFVWDFWNVPGQYTALRTPAFEYFPKKIYEAFHRELVQFGRDAFGCHDVSPPWLSCYINGCSQELHGDLPHGPLAFVYSLTRFPSPHFRGGETLLLRNEILDYWSDFVSERSIEEKDVLRTIAPNFNRLTVFDPRIPHGVRRVDGTMNPVEGRLVIHGWFVNPRPFVVGPVSEDQIATLCAGLMNHLAPSFDPPLPFAGLLSLRFTVSRTGAAGAPRILVDTTRVPAHFEPRRKEIVRRATRFIAAYPFGKARAPSTVTLPLVFAQS